MTDAMVRARALDGFSAVVKELGGADNVSSPSFSIVNEYYFANGALLGYHFDFYRLENETEVLDIGFEEYLDKGVWVFMEWPEKIASFLPKNTTAIYLEVIDEKMRKLRLE